MALPFNKHRSSSSHPGTLWVLAVLCLLFITSAIKAEEKTYSFLTGETWQEATKVFAFDDWHEFDQNMRQQDGHHLFWIVINVDNGGEAAPEKDWELRLHMLASYEVYFDGIYIGQNGKPSASKTEEVPGNIWNSFLIPNQLLTPGKHKLVLYASSHHRTKGMKLLREVMLNPYDSQFRYIQFSSLMPTLLVSMCAVIGIYFLILFVVESRQWEHLVFFALLMSLTAYGFAIQWDHLVGYTYDLEAFNLLIEKLGILSFVILLPCFFLLRYGIAKFWLWLLVGLLFTQVVIGVSNVNEAAIYWGTSFGLALIINVCYGFRQGKHYWWESLGLAMCLVGVVTQPLENIFFYMPVFLTLVLLTHAFAARQKENALMAAELTETTLKADLLKKHIQPHFLFNTLTTMMEWTETDPDKNVLFIHTLAEEFKLMSKVTASQLSDLKTEIQLCEKHLQLMSLRLNKECTLEVTGIDGEEAFPPAIFQTLLENAFSHNQYESQQLTFQLSKSHIADDQYRFEFSVPMGVKDKGQFSQIGTGTGLKYIKARLTQCFGQHWSISDSEVNHEWCTQIDVDYKKLEGVSTCR